MSSGSENEIIQDATQAENNQGRTILLAEDDVSNADMLRLLVQSETPYQLIQFTNEEEIFRRIDDIKAARPDLFLFDYRLSSMTALDLYDRLHSIEELQNVPAIVITASLVNEEEFATRNIPIIQKPFDVDELLRAINQILA
jgi:CheY-like chemotaxis protein